MTARHGTLLTLASRPASNSWATLAQEVNRIRGAPTDEPSFRAYDLNEALSPTREMILSPDDLRACFADDPPARQGGCFLGFDFGEAVSSTAAVAVWPATGRLETWQAFGDVPPLAERARRDSAPYAAMVERGELRTYPGRIVRPDAFLADLQTDLAGCRVVAAGADSYKDSEVRDFLDRAARALAYRLPPRRRREGWRPRRARLPTPRAARPARHGRKPFTRDGYIQEHAAQGRQRQPWARPGDGPGAYRRAERGRDRVRPGRVGLRPAGPAQAPMGAGRMSRNHVRLHARRWATVRRFVFKRDGYRCVMCGRAGRLECDHINPLEREPGQDPYDVNGLQTLCRRCHVEKTRAENTRPVSPEQRAWQVMVEELLRRPA